MPKFLVRNEGKLFKEPVGYFFTSARDINIIEPAVVAEWSNALSQIQVDRMP